MKRMINIAVAFLACIAIILSVDYLGFSKELDSLSQSDDQVPKELVSEDQLVEEQINEVLFPEDEVIEVYLQVDDADFQQVLDNPMDETYVLANMIYNGITVDNIGLRTKGNSSLRSVANSESERYSFKIDLDYYFDNQNMFGVTKINLNNGYKDPSLMREYLAYEIMEGMGLSTPRTVYTALYINNEYYGLYLAVEQVDETFINSNYEYTSGDLFKPDGKTGSDLVWNGDNIDNYPGLILKTNELTSDYSSIINMLDVLNNSGNIETVLNVENVLKYFAVSTTLVNLDSYQGKLLHNYYLYDNNGIFEIIPWDLNMAFGGFDMESTSNELINFMIDEPTMYSLEERPLIAELLKNEAYLELYHSYIQEIIDIYLNEQTFKTRIEEIVAMIDEYVQKDAHLFYSYDDFQQSLYEDIEGVPALITFTQNRVESVINQLNGTQSSYGDGSGNSSGGGRNMSPTGNMGGKEMKGMRQPDGMRPEGGMLPSEGKVPPDGRIGNNMNKMPEEGIEKESLSMNVMAQVQSNIVVIVICFVGMIGLTCYYSFRKSV